MSDCNSITCELPINNLNIEEIKNKNILLIGKKDSGKTYLIRDILNQLNTTKENITVISRKDRFKPFYCNFVNEENIYFEYDSKILENLINIQIDNQKSLEQKYLIIDISLNNDSHKDTFLQELIYNGRFYKITLIISSQFALCLPPEFRSNMDYVFLFSEDNITNKKRLYDKYGGIFKNYKQFNGVFSALTSNQYGCMVIKNIGSGNVLDKIFYYKACPDDQNLMYSEESVESLNTIETQESKNSFKSETKEIRIKTFNFDTMRKNSSMLCIAKRGNKYNLISNIINNLNIKNTIVFSKTERMNEFYSNFINKENIHYEYDSEEIGKILFEQEKNIEKYKKGDITEDEITKFIILDDCFSSSYKWQKDQPLSELVFNGRHYKIGFLIINQVPIHIPPEFRVNFDYIFLMADDTIYNTKIMYDYYGGMFSTYYEFINVFNLLTTDEGCMIINNKISYTKDISEKIFCYKAYELNNINSREFIDKETKQNILGFSEFKLESMVKHPHIVCIAKRGSGKSYLVRNIIQELGYKNNVIVFSRTERVDSFYKNFASKENIHFEYKKEEVEKILREQEINVERFKKGLISEEEASKFVVLDDCLPNKASWVEDQAIQELLFNGRHYMIGYILTRQFPLGITPELRCNFDYVYLMAEDTISNSKRIYDHFAGMFPNFYAFKQVFSELTKDYRSMVIINRGVTSDIFEKVYHYKAPYYNENNFELNQNINDLYPQRIDEINNEEIISEEKINDNKSLFSESYLNSSDRCENIDRESLLKIVNIIEKIITNGTGNIDKETLLKIVNIVEKIVTKLLK